MKRILLLAVLLFTSSVQAIEPLAFFERPLFMSAWLPDQIPCAFDTRTGQGQCVAPDLPLKVNAVLVKLDGTGKHTISYPTLGRLKCFDGICDDITLTSVGLLESPNGWPAKKLTTWIITENYYLNNDDGVVSAWRRGKGPQALAYPEPMIYNEYHYTKAVNGTITYQVWCNPQADVCDLGGREYARDQLRLYIPVTYSDNCSMEFCYDKDMNVVGLNNDYPFGDPK